MIFLYYADSSIIYHIDCCVHLELPHVLPGADHGYQVQPEVVDGEPGHGLAQGGVIVTSRAHHVPIIIIIIIIAIIIFMITSS